MKVHVRIRLVVGHVVDHTIETQRGAVGDAETDTSEAACTEIVSVAVSQRATVQLVAGARSASTENELALPVHQSEREVIVQTHRERMAFTSRLIPSAWRPRHFPWSVFAVTFAAPRGSDLTHQHFRRSKSSFGFAHSAESALSSNQLHCAIHRFRLAWKRRSILSPHRGAHSCGTHGAAPEPSARSARTQSPCRRIELPSVTADSSRSIDA